MPASPESVFTSIAIANSWGSPESVSGPGSTKEATESLRLGLSDALRKLEIRSIIDAPCGDLNWIRHLEYQFERYTGIDIVPSIINSLRAMPAISGYHFQVGNIVTDILPAADALLCRDCLVHLPYSAIHDALRLWRLAGFRYVMTTSFIKHERNEDCEYGGWRPLNLLAPPFSLPAPEMVIADNDGLAPPYDDKSLGIWRIK